LDPFTDRKSKERWPPCSTGKGAEEAKNAQVSFSLLPEKVSRWLVQVTSARERETNVKKTNSLMEQIRQRLE